MSYGQINDSVNENVKTVEVSRVSAKTRRNRISKSQRMDCFREALPDFWKAVKSYQPKTEPRPAKVRGSLAA